MAREKGRLALCLRKTLHHCDPYKIDWIVTLGTLEGFKPIKHLKHRFDLIRANLMIAMGQLEKVRQAAQAAGCQLVLDALNEEIELGHPSQEVPGASV